MVELRRIIEGNAGQEKEIENHESGEGNRLQIEIHEGGVSFRKGKVQLTTRALEGPFPEYDYVIPKGCRKSGSNRPDNVT